MQRQHAVRVISIGGIDARRGEPFGSVCYHEDAIVYDRLKAINECYLLWRALQDSGDYSKEPSLSLLHRKGLLSLARYELNCPLCEYTRKKAGWESCSICPIKWPILKKYRDDRTPNPCLNSYFAIWRFGDRRIRKAAAGAIVKLFESQHPSVVGETMKRYPAGRMRQLANRQGGPEINGRRGWERISLHTRVLLHSEAHHLPTEAELINISLEGAYVSTRAIPSVGKVCELEMRLPLKEGGQDKEEGQAVNIPGTVIHREKGGLGIRFYQALDPSHLAVIISKSGKAKKAAGREELS